MNKKIITKKYDVYNKKNNKNIKIILISDIHLSSIFKVDKLNLLYKKINMEKPDYICISGDLIDGTNVLDEKIENIMIDFFKELSNICKVIISLGNHDVSTLMKRSFNPEWKEKNNKSFWNKIDNINNIYFLNNKVYSDKNFNFIGINPSLNYYKYEEEDNDILRDEINNLNILFDKNKYNILLCHSPIHILDKDVLDTDFMNKIDLILSGHMHNGMVPPLLDKLWHSNRGIITPAKKFFSKNERTRGIIRKKDKVLVISGGITKLSYSSPKFFHLFTELFPMNIEIINVK